MRRSDAAPILMDKSVLTLDPWMSVEELVEPFTAEFGLRIRITKDE